MNKLRVVEKGDGCFYVQKRFFFLSGFWKTLSGILPMRSPSVRRSEKLRKASSPQCTPSLLEASFFRDVYDVLVTEGRADPDRIDCFVESHCRRPDLAWVCKEWRFCGHFGLGGKYWRRRNMVDYYADPADKELDELAMKINSILKELHDEYAKAGLDLGI